MTVTASTPRGTAALTARASCEAGIGWRTELVDGFPKERIEVCSQVVGLASFLGTDNRRHVYCAVAGHQASVRQRFTEARILVAPRRYRAEGCPTCDNIASALGGFGPGHEASAKCESGSYSHCSCDSCW